MTELGRTQKKSRLHSNHNTGASAGSCCIQQNLDLGRGESFWCFFWLMADLPSISNVFEVGL